MTMKMPPSRRIAELDLSDPHIQARVRRLRALARTLDLAFEIPGTGRRFGLDSVIGLIPGVGDAATAALSGYIVYEAWRLGASRATLGKMLGNIGLDFAAGSIPVLGDLFDFAFKANVRNLRLLGIDVRNPEPGPRRGVANTAPRPSGQAV